MISIHLKPAIKNAIEQVYAVFLPKGSHPFVYMDLRIEPKNLDVNVHPTKHEVNFLYENEIIDKIKEAFEAELMVCPDAKEKYTQKLLPGASDPDTDLNEQSPSQSKESKVYAKDIIRYDFKDQKLQKFFGKSSQKQPIDSTTDMNLTIPLDESDSRNDSDATMSQRTIATPRISMNVERK